MLLILRHGETEWNVAGRMQGGLDSPLTARGRQQARDQGAILRAAGLGQLPLLVSPLGRAMQTARLALPGVAPQPDPRLAEVAMGHWQGLTRDEIAANWPEALDDPHPFRWKFRAPGGESFEQLADRLGAFAAERPGPAIVVTHGVTSQVLRGILLGMDLESMAGLEDRQGCVWHVGEGQHMALDCEA
ncbi:histidine phosphatase family protein [Tropicimonas sp. IMCC34043]|uniref:histidine phosphatase family protein n=1 Tax=Tropicimonas sp. IMCC34043 TaxID=2248760 RepID=UPI000E27DCF6|nr:histidine phosphatase family protein [Tropicimonas sp. IMCC34043]